jgi:transcription elongation factor S-II
MSREESDLVQLKASLQKALDTDAMTEVLDILNILASFPMKYDLLANTKVGVTVNQVKKKVPDSDSCHSLAVDTLKKWKKIYDQGATTTTITSSSTSASEKETKEKKTAPKEVKAEPKKTELSRAASVEDDEELDDIQLLPSGRKQAVELFKSVLAASTNAGVANSLAFHIEQSLDAMEPYAQDHKKYSAKVRSLAANLKRNEELRLELVEGTLSPQNLVHLSPAELATQAQREQREQALNADMEARRTDSYQLNRAKILEANGLNPNGIGEFTCRKCKGTKTTHYSLQTRSADEPMTVFVTCLVRDRIHSS